MSWDVKPLEEVCNVEFGTRVVKKKDGGSVYPVYGGGGATFSMDEFNREDRLVVARFAMSEQCTRFVEGKFFLNDSGLTVSPRDNRKLAQNFLNYHLLALNDEIYALGKGTAQRNLESDAFRRLTLSVPESLPEQQRIVGKLDAAFVALTEAQAHVERNRANARELFVSYLNGVFEGKGWKDMALEDVADDNCTLSYGIVQPGEEFENGMPVVRPTDLTAKVISLNGLKRIDPKLAKGYKRTELHGGELLLCVRGSTGVLSIASDELIGANVTRGIVPIRFKDNVKPAFAYYLMKSPAVQNQIREKTTGTALMQINIGDLRKVRITIPPVKEQERIAIELDAFDLDTRQLETTYQHKLVDLAGLKKAVLGAAFRGEL